MTTQALITTNFQIDAVIEQWLEEKFTTKSRSKKTLTAYHDTIISFRHALQDKGLDLDTDDRAAIVETTQQWAGQRAENVSMEQGQGRF
jgi:site-specific recombinase XerD